ncbi:HpcH/HpaI aldolase family protein [Aspergillus puulaauensis]|uniref:HpcH/HpaI aldolase/citrate lyase domain-containing protein n=1 Tax=Aspergillus puulaauensis TaxID=1220207 RepID=A0A7R7XXH8_9EURO|nr:uncharacterized protein APUU_71106S [Aspergillus puulaauensis]BCS29536.1 hypothetical protein APUU_71106S [Aspergillus puulaauensis]
MALFPNNVLHRADQQALCCAFGIRLVTSPAIVQLAKNAGFDSLFIDLEHSTLTINEASQLCVTALLAGITPVVRVPHQCGDGFVQRVLDGGAMGVVFPHIHGPEDARSAARISKYPPNGTRSMTGQLPQFSLLPTPIPTVIAAGNAAASTVFLMVETKTAVEPAVLDAIAAVPDVDILLVGANDLSIELGVPGQFESEVFRDALRAVSRAAGKHGKIMGLAGIYGNREVLEWAVRDLGVGWLLGGQDSGVLAGGMASVMTGLQL